MDQAQRDCEVLFDTSTGGKLENGWASGVLHQRTRTTTAGPMVYVDCFPVWDRTARSAAREEARKKSHRKAQERANRKRAQRRLITLVNANFGAGDLIMTLEYGLGHQPEDEERAAKDMRNYLARVKRRRTKADLPELKYLYITERTESAAYGVRFHHHLIMSGGLSREEAEQLWGKGYANSRRAQPTEKHLSGFACYLVQDKTSRKQEEDGRNPQHRATHRAFCASRNLKEPRESVADKKISIRKAGRIAESAQDFGQMQEVFRRLYPDCELLEVNAYTSPWAAGVYVRAELRKRAA